MGLNNLSGENARVEETDELGSPKDAFVVVVETWKRYFHGALAVKQRKRHYHE